MKIKNKISKIFKKRSNNPRKEYSNEKNGVNYNKVSYNKVSYNKVSRTEP